MTLAPDGNCIIVDKLQDNATAARGTGVTFLPSIFGRPHLVWSTRPGGSRWCSTPWPSRVHRSRYRWKRSRYDWRHSRIRYGCGCCAPWPAHHR
ncbi:DUF5937 family protein [Streptomyces sp. NPDC058221]|uniref:DUF5937 family protein n=1 Tax=Streptomyces sp. NPDC058221 TaxID=3346388 RepID=UPI0036EB6FF0